MLQRGQIKEFEQLHGDYYVAAMVIGADSGVYASFSSAAADSQEALHVQLEGHVLGIDGSKVIASMEAASKSQCSTKLEVFDSLWKRHESHTLEASAASADYIQLQTAAQVYLQASSMLADRVEKAILDALGSTQLQLGVPTSRVRVDLREVGALCVAGLVVELILMPFSTLRSYQVATTRRV